MTIVRELNGGIYYGARNEPNATLDSASDLDCYTRAEIERITRLAGALAVAHNPPLCVTSLDKANLLAACGRLWRGVVSETMAREFPSVELKHMLIDSAAMVMVRDPRSLNGVVLTSNMFGDIISDEASVIPGSLGLLPSASLCGIPSEDPQGRVRGLYEPIHGEYPFDSKALSWFGLVFLLTTGFFTTGSAPDIAGKGIVNPVGMILSVAMMLRYSLGMPDEAKLVETAVSKVIEDGIRTPDLGGSATSKECGDAIVAALVGKNMSS
jgi:3-isopropylmalate dehydrogenase